MQVDRTELTSLLSAADAIVRRGGERMLAREQQDFRIEAKSAANFVTEVDLAVEAMIVGELRRLTPDFQIVTEEAEANPSSLDRPTWILDPVDGTTNLMRHFRHSAVSLALADPKGLRIGLVFNPYSDEMFRAAEGLGATMNGRTIRTSRFSQLQDCLVGFGTTPYDRSQSRSTFELVESIFMSSLEIRRSGSAALDLAYVACGRLDVFFEQTLQPWDFAAGSLILHEAGGLVTTWNGRSPDLTRASGILASNGLVHDIILRMMESGSHH